MARAVECQRAERGSFDPRRHEPRQEIPWNPEAVRDAVAAIEAELHACLEPDGWRDHPLDEPKGTPRSALYAGAAGAVVALRLLGSSGPGSRDAVVQLEALHGRFRTSPDYRPELGLQLGEIGILTPLVLADPGHRLRSRLEECMREIVGHPAREITSGEAGMLHAAWTLHEATGEPVWAQLFEVGADSLSQAWSRQADGQWLWRSAIFGSERHYYGACHGVAGNAGALLRGASLLPSARIASILERCVATLEAGALRSDAGLNWPVSADPSGQRRLVQWCHGAPGVVVALAGAPRSGETVDAALDAILTRAGELSWCAGPLAKGPGVCHGTAGNGYAFLALHARTGETRWLERARAFAMHALGQWMQARREHGRGRTTLWTGDAGLALYLQDCLRPGPVALPGLERF